MKLSKRLAAALMAMCMLLVSVPAFAATVYYPNESMVLPTDGTTISISSTGLGNANNYVGIVIKPDTAKTLGIDIANITSRITTEGTDYDGLLLSGKMKLRNYNYKSDLSTAVSKSLYYNELAEFEFADAEVVAIRTNNDKNAIVLELPAQNYLDALVSGTAKKLAAGKITGEETETVTFTEEDLVVLTAEEETALNGGARFDGETLIGNDFANEGSDAYIVSNLKAKAGSDYKSGIAVDSKHFPEGTIFIASTKLNANGATIKTDWSSASYHSFYAFSGTDEPYGVYFAPETREYRVYALKTHYSTQESARIVKVGINDKIFSFEHETAPEGLASTKGWYWEKDETQTLSLAKDGVISVKLNTLNCAFARAAGLALVPVDKVAEMEAVEGWNDFTKTNGFSPEEFEILHDLTTTDFVEPDPVTAVINVNGKDYEVSSVDAETVLPVDTIDFDGAFVANVTVMDALVKAGIITAENAANYDSKLNVKFEGTTITEYNKWLLYGGEKITADINETVDATNFAPMQLSKVINTYSGNNNGLKFCLTSSKMVGTQLEFALKEIIDGKKDEYYDDALKDAKVNGYALTTNDITVDKVGSTTGEKVTIPQGARAYFNNCNFTGEVVRSGTTYGFQLMGIKSNNKTTEPLYIELPDGTYTNHPYRIQQANYEYTNAYITNSSTTNELKVRYMSGKNKWQLYTDGGKHVCIVKYSVDGEGNLDSVVSMEDKYVLVGAPVSFELKDNERAYIWGYAPYSGEATGGTTMVPLTSALANPAE